MKRGFGVLVVAAVLTLVQARPAVAQSGDFVAGSRDLFVMDLASTPTGELPQVCGPKVPPPCLEMMRGNVTTVDKDGSHMLRAADPAQVWIRIPQVMPNDFTIELDLIPKPLGIAPSDFAIEGTRETNRGDASLMLEWQTQAIMVVGGAQGASFQRPQPEDLKATTPSELTEIRISYNDGALKMYVNGQRLVNLPKLAFARNRGLRLELGGADDDKAAVYLAKFRLATNSPKPQ